MNSKKYLLYCIVIVLVFGAGFYVGRGQGSSFSPLSNTSAMTNADFGPFWKVWDLIGQKFPHASDVTDQDRVWGAIKGLASSMHDPYTVFFPPQEAKDFESVIAGAFGGIGIEIGMKDDLLTVIAPLKDTPAYTAGVKAGDKILKINDTTTADMSIDEAINEIRGEKGTTVKLTIAREGDTEPREFIIARDTIEIPTLDYKLRSDGIYVISLYNFSANADTLFRKAMLDFIQSGSKKLVIDVRGNPGGYLDAAVDMASWFLPEGKVVVQEDYGGNQPNDDYRSKGYSGVPKGVQVVMLVDQGSASASEILAGALHEYGVAKLVGEQTFGKGSVQEPIQITPDTLLKVTVAKWLTPNGISISEHGLTPDEVIKGDGIDDYSSKDKQFQKAKTLLESK